MKKLIAIMTLACITYSSFAQEAPKSYVASLGAKKMHMTRDARRLERIEKRIKTNEELKDRLNAAKEDPEHQMKHKKAPFMKKDAASMTGQ